MSGPVYTGAGMKLNTVNGHKKAPEICQISSALNRTAHEDGRFQLPLDRRSELRSGRRLPSRILPGRGAYIELVPEPPAPVAADVSRL